MDPLIPCIVRFVMRFEGGLGIRHTRLRLDNELVSRQQPVGCISFHGWLLGDSTPYHIVPS